MELGEKTAEEEKTNIKEAEQVSEDGEEERTDTGAKVETDNRRSEAEQINIEVKREMKTSGATEQAGGARAEQADGATCLNWYKEQASDALITVMLDELVQTSQNLSPHEKLNIREGGSVRMEQLRMIVSAAAISADSATSQLEAGGVDIFTTHLNQMGEAIKKGSWFKAETETKGMKKIELDRDLTRRILALVEALPRAVVDVSTLRHQPGRKVDNLRQAHATLDEMLQGTVENFSNPKFKVNYTSFSNYSSLTLKF